MEPRTRRLAIHALSSGLVMILGVAATLILTRHDVKPRSLTINRWRLRGSIPLPAAGLAAGVISRGSRQVPATHEIIDAAATTLLMAAPSCALIGAVAALSGTRRGPGKVTRFRLRS